MPAKRGKAGANSLPLETAMMRGERRADDNSMAWYFNAMESTIDKAGRVIIPASIRARLGLVPGPVNILIEGADVRITALTPNALTTREGRTVIAADGPALTADDIRELRLADQR
jgi:AbrB family looped-hinge helix DNA binding protein